MWPSQKILKEVSYVQYGAKNSCHWTSAEARSFCPWDEQIHAFFWTKSMNYRRSDGGWIQYYTGVRILVPFWNSAIADVHIETGMTLVIDSCSEINIWTLVSSKGNNCVYLWQRFLSRIQFPRGWQLTNYDINTFFCHLLHLFWQQCMKRMLLTFCDKRGSLLLTWPNWSSAWPLMCVCFDFDY